MGFNKENMDELIDVANHFHPMQKSPSNSGEPTDLKIVVAAQIQMKHKIQCKLHGNSRDHPIYHLLF